MAEKVAKAIMPILLILFGIYVYKHPDGVAYLIKTMYKGHPFYKKYSDEQLTPRPFFVKMIGVFFILLGTSPIIYFALFPIFYPIAMAIK